MASMSSIAGAPPYARHDVAAGEVRTRPIQRLLLPLLVLTALLSQVFAGSGNSTIAWVTALTFATFILVVNGPAWALVPILINELTLYGFSNPMFGMSQRFVVAGVAVVFTAVAISRGRLFSDRSMRRVLLPSIGFVVIVTIMNMQHSEDTYVYEYLRYQLVQVMMLVIAACVIVRVRELKQIAIVAVVITTVVSLIVIWQHYAPSTAIYGFRDGTVKGRAVGFTNGPVPIASQFIFLLAPMLGVLIAMPFRLQRKYLLLAGSVALTAAALNFTYTRSALFALAPTLVIMAFLFGGRRRMLMLGTVIIGLFLFVALENTGLFGSRYYEDADDDRSAASHEALQDVSLAIALDNPVTGIGHEQFTTVSLDYIDAVDVELSALGGDSAIGQQQPHNDFWNVWLSWGIVALIAFIAIFLGTFRNLIIGARHRDPFVRGLAIGCIGGLVTYGVNSVYHNSLDSSMSLWLYAGLSVALARLAQQAPAATGRQPATEPIQYTS